MPRFFVITLSRKSLAAALCLVLLACSRAETKRIAGEAVQGSMRSACASARNCTLDCSDGTRVPQGAKCAESP